jgi:hypothetical protein
MQGNHPEYHGILVTPSQRLEGLAVPPLKQDAPTKKHPIKGNECSIRQGQEVKDLSQYIRLLAADARSWAPNGGSNS